MATLAPRPLTPDQIEIVRRALRVSILGTWDQQIYPFPTIQALEGFLDTFTLQLQTVRLIPDATIWDQFRTWVVSEFEQAHIDPGAPIGLTASEALSAPVMQIALNSFHSSGSSKNVSSALEMLEAIIYARKKLPYESVRVTFRDRGPNFPVTFEDIFEKRRQIVSLPVSYFVKESQIGARADLVTPVPEPGQPLTDAPAFWTAVYITINNIALRDSSNILRLHLRKERLFSYQITVHDLIKAIERTDEGKSIVLIPSPAHLAILDIYPKTSELPKQVIKEISRNRRPFKDIKFPTSTLTPPVRMTIPGSAAPVPGATEFRPENDVEIVFLDHFVVSKFDRTYVGNGIRGIRDVNPVTEPVWSIVDEEKRIYDDFVLIRDKSLSLQEKQKRRQQWVIVLSQGRMKRTGIRKREVEHLLIACGAQIVPSGDQDRFTVHLQMRNNKLPSAFIAEALKLDTARELEFELARRKEDPEFRASPSAIGAAAKHVTGEAEINSDDNSIIVFRKILGRRDVDPTRTTPSAIHTNNAVLGIESTRDNMINTTIGFVSADGPTNPRHTTLLVDQMVVKGIITPVTLLGITTGQGTVMEKICVGQATQTLLSAGQSAIRNEPTGGPTTSIAVARRIGHGTGRPRMGVDVEAAERLLEETEITIDESNWEEAVDQFTRKINASGMIEGLNDEDALVALRSDVVPAARVPDLDLPRPGLPTLPLLPVIPRTGLIPPISGLVPIPSIGIPRPIASMGSGLVPIPLPRSPGFPGALNPVPGPSNVVDGPRIPSGLPATHFPEGPRPPLATNVVVAHSLFNLPKPV